MSSKKKNRELPKHRSIVTLGMILSRKGGPMRLSADKRKEQHIIDDDAGEFDDDTDAEEIVP